MSFTLVHGGTPPNTAVNLVQQDVPEMDAGEGQVLVQMLAAPINRVDLMMLSGLYPVTPQFSIDGSPIPGFDGCGKVLESSSLYFQSGDIVMPAELGLGTWRSHAIFPETSLIKLPRHTPPVAGALLRSGAVVAWLLLEHITRLSPGDWIIMSAGTSCVAQCLVQMARAKGVNVILIIRDREDMDARRSKLLELGAAAVWSESELSQGGKSPGKIVMAIDCVFGEVGQNLANMLSTGGKFIMAGMLGGPSTKLLVDTKHLFQKQLSFQGFRSSSILDAMGKDKVANLLCHIASLFDEGLLVIPDIDVVAWDGQDDLESVLQRKIVEAGRDVIGYKKTVWKFTL